MDSKTMKMLGIVALAGGAYLLYAKQSSPTPLSWLPQFQGTYLPQALRPATDQTLAAATLLGTTLINSLPTIFKAGNNLLASSGGVATPITSVPIVDPTGIDWTAYQLPAGSGVLSPTYMIEPPVNYIPDYSSVAGVRGLSGYDIVGGGGYIEPFNYTDDYDTYELSQGVARGI